MVNSCCAYKCKTRHVKGGSISFHVFPSDGLLRKKWAIATKRENFVPTKSTRICSKHFKDTDYVITFGRKTLVKNAVPSIFNFPQRLQRKVCTTNTRRLNKDEINVQDTAKQMRFSSTSETSVKRAKLEESSTSSLMYGQLPIVTETISVNQTAYKKTSPVVKRMENLKCRLCLDDLQENESVTLEEFGMNMLKTLLPKVDLRISTEPKICDKCIKLLVVCYEFKTMILENNVKEEKVFTLEKDEQLCRLCGKEIFEECENLTEWKEMADKCVPELDIFSSNNVTSCQKCMGNLTNLNMFLDKVIAVQANIKTDFVVKREPVNLDNLFAFLNSPNNEHKNIKPKEELKSEIDITYNQVIQPIEKMEILTSYCAPGQRGNNISTNTEIPQGHAPIETVKFPRKEDPDIYDVKELQGNKTDPTLNAETHQDPLLNCHTCSFKTKHKKGLKNHLKTHLPVRNEWFYCDTCSFKTFAKRYLDRHLNQHKEIDKGKTKKAVKKSK